MPNQQQKQTKKKRSTLKESDFNKLRAAALFRPSLCAEVFKIEMTGLPECFTKKQQMYHGNKSQLLKIFDLTLSLSSTFKKDALILDFSATVNSQAAVTTADGIIVFVKNLSTECSHIDITCDSYFDNSLKSHTREARGCGQFFPFTEATNIPEDFQGNFLRHNRNKVALNSFPTSKLLTHDFGGAIVFISVKSGVKCNSTDVYEEVLHIGRTQEQAHTKIIVHVRHCLLNGFRNNVVKTVSYFTIRNRS